MMQVVILAVASLILAIAVSIPVMRTQRYNGFQKFLLLVAIWVIPIIGPIFAWGSMRFGRIGSFGLADARSEGFWAAESQSEQMASMHFGGHDSGGTGGHNFDA